MPRLVLMCGMPGSGKTTRARQLAASLPAVRLCPDEWMAGLGIDLFADSFRDQLERVMWQHAQELLTAGLSVVLESGHWLRSDRDEKRAWARRAEIPVELHFLAVPLEERWQRLQRRNAVAGHGSVPLRRAQLEEYVTHFQVPDAEELAHFNEPFDT